MATSPSRYRPDAPPDYDHRFHAGNVGDVWKHCVLVALLERLRAGRVAYLETHAGRGRYPLGATGEWTEGIGRLWADPGSAGGDAVDRYLQLCHRLAPGDERPHTYPGSPLFARAVLGAAAPLVLWERAPDTCASLRQEFAGDDAARIHCGDGLAALEDALAAAEASADHVVALIDPPYSQKRDWAAVADALVRAVHRAPRASLMLWYPVKSLTRPNAMVATLAAVGVRATLVELVTTPLAHQRQRLNGSGVVLVRPPEGATAAIAAAAAILGARCAVRAGVWSARVVSW